MARPRQTHCLYGHPLVVKGARQRCVECGNKRQREYSRLRGPEVAREKNLARYGLTLEQWNEMFKAQDFKCAICGSDDHKDHRTWHTDHNHATGKVRGILCRDCNHGLGHYEKMRQYDLEGYLHR